MPDDRFPRKPMLTYRAFKALGFHQSTNSPNMLDLDAIIMQEYKALAVDEQPVQRWHGVRLCHVFFTVLAESYHHIVDHSRYCLDMTSY